MTAKPLVLVVEDEAALATLLKYNLERENYRVRGVRDGEEALIAADEEAPDGSVVEGGEVDLGEDHAGRGAALEAVHRVDEDVALAENGVAEQVVVAGGRAQGIGPEAGDRREGRVLAAAVGTVALAASALGSAVPARADATDAAVAPKGGSITISLSQHDAESAELTVSDTGPGIPPDDMEHLFEPFFTTKGEMCAGAFRKAGADRINNLARIHSLLAANRWDGASMACAAAISGGWPGCYGQVAGTTQTRGVELTGKAQIADGWEGGPAQDAAIRC